jgi:FkbM family methyltransferase
VAAIERTLKPADIFYDVGANIGIFCLLASTIVGPSGRVVAFEPEDNNLVCFRRTLKKGPTNIQLLPLAVGNEDGTMTFDRRGGAFSGRLVADREAAFDAIEVQVRSLDGLIAGGLPPPDLIKIDVEGGEGSVLEGGTALLKRGTCTVLCEMHPGNNPEGVRRAFTALKAAGYGLTVLGGGAIAEPLVTQGTYHVLAHPNSKPHPGLNESVCG